jgi:hypothetical protein
MPLWKPSFFLLPKMSKRGARLARASSLGHIHCLYLAEKKQWPNFWLTRFEAVQPEQLAKHNTYFIARQVADQVVAQVQALLPDFFECAGLNLQALFRFQLQTFFAYSLLPLLASGLRKIPAGSPVTLIDSRISAKILQTLMDILPEANSQEFFFKSTTTPKNVEGKLRQWQNEAQALTPPKETGGAWGFISHPEHFKLTDPVLDALAETQAIRYIWGHEKAPEADQPLLTLAKLPPLPDSPSLHLWIQHFNDLLKAIQTLGKDEKPFCLSQMELLMELCRKTLLFEGFVQQHQPQALVGCLEYNPFGVIARLLRQKAHYRLINVQHGIVSPIWKLDALHFDDYLIWNEQTAQVLQAENYPNPNGLHILGNPKWEALEEAIQSEKTSATFEEIMRWKGTAPLIAAYTQALQGYSTAQVKMQYIEALLAYLRENPQFKILIKKHPLEQDTIAEDLVLANGLAERVRILPARELTLWESLKAADVVTSVFSATLLEALYLRKPVVAIDLENTIARQCIPVSSALRVVTQKDRIGPALAEAIATTPHNQLTHDLAPRFEENYRQRVRQALFSSLAPSSSS